ncbi:MAG: TonB-dependent receptor [Lewinellaceae bacterium]|nr:TonB-dependent receptor [Lewinellaceae bacterium]
MRHYLFAVFLLSIRVLFAQNDSTLLLAPEHLGYEDIATRDADLEKSMVVSGTRSLEEVDQLPFTVWVVTAEDILRNGFVTLGDVLRAAPGVRVSQPGNALEGETFLMRGLSGNKYVKVLINDMPVKPGTALGMPIGAQLPIRQAERIEVIYGPASSIYGTDACAGVVNIILKETERPIFTQADLAFGNLGYNSLDLMLGGKLGKDKNVFRFSLYGSNTIRERTDIFYDPNLFNVNHYLPFGLDTMLYLDNRNYRANQPPSDSFPKVAAIPHESRLLGINLNWRGVHLTYNRMARFDHMALGISPLAVSYANPSNRLAEYMETYALRFSRKRPKWVTHNTISAIRYRIDNTSTTTYVFDKLSAATYRAIAANSGMLSDSQRTNILRNIYRELASNERYTVGNGIDLRFESLLNASLSSRIFLDAGVMVNTSAGTPALSHYEIPIDIRVDGTTSPNVVMPYDPSLGSDLVGNLFAQLVWKGKRLYVIGCGSVNYSVNYGFVPLPRIGMQYRLDSTWSVRANYSTGIRRPSLFARGNTYYIIDLNDPIISVSPSRADATEKINAWEAGLRYSNRNVRAEGIFFSEKVYRMLRPGAFDQEPGIVAPWRYGWDNAPGLSMTMWGLQGLVGITNQEVDIRGSRKRTRITGRTELFMQYTRGKEWLGEERRLIDDVFNAPRWQFQFRTFFTVNKLEMMLASNRQTSVLSKSIIYRDDYERKVVQERYPVFRSWDLMLRLYLSNHFLLYFNMQNVFNKHYSGLDATGTPDDLLFNPQQGRLIRFGINYNMN